MQTHPFFTNIWMHDDEELAQALGIEIAERQTIHEWPLSCVQQTAIVSSTGSDLSSGHRRSIW
jgi:hypothetical protein